MITRSNSTLRCLIWSALVWALGLAFASGQQVYWSPNSGTLQQGKANRLQLHFEGCSPAGNVDLPTTSNVDFTRVGQSSSMNIFNSQVVQKLIVEYQVSPTAQGELTIPEFAVDTDQGTLNVQAAKFDVTEATVGNTGMRPEDIFKSELSSVEDSIYEGEIFTLRYVLGVRQDYQNRLNDISQPQWNPVGVVTKGFENHRSTNFKFRNHNYSAILFEAPAMATRNGIIKLPKVNQTVSMVVGRRRGFIFDDPVVDNYNIDSETLELDIQALPTGEPPSFTGAVGEFGFESKIVPEIVQVGEPITWTLELSGTGNWPQGFSLNPRNVATSFRTIQPDINKEISEDSPFEGSLAEDIVLIPTQSGDFQFGPVEFSFFNPKSERYETISVPEKTIIVNAIAPSRNAGQSQSDPLPSSSASTDDNEPTLSLDPSGINLLSKPAELVRSPMKPGRQEAIPRGGVRLSNLAFSFITPALLWLSIAFVRSIKMDPNRSRRQAFRQLRATAMSLCNSDSELRKTQLAWREAAKQFWGIEMEEPSSDDIAEAVSEKSNAEVGKRWKILWQNSDRILFGKKAPSFKEWQTELRDLIAQNRAPGMSLNQIFTQRAWFASLALLCFALTTLESDSDEGTDDYNAGSFAEAETTWKQSLNSNEGDWALRNNLGLAAAQQNKWGEAIAHWTSAFLLQTRNSDIKWNLEVGLSQGGGYHPTLARLVKGDGLMAYISLWTPAQWENLAYWAMIVAGSAFSAWVLFAYTANLRSIRFSLAIVGLAAVASVFAFEYARSQYGFMANPNALVVISEDRLKSVPTDLDVEQIETPLPEGSICLVSKSFLGWVKVVLPNGEEGWSRKENFAFIYGAGAVEDRISESP